jgi:hypothetical protein
MIDAYQKIISEDRHLKNGFYIFENKIYYNKIEALIEASKKKSDIQFYFNDGIFSAFDWTLEPNKNLWDIYTARARQIRENFDHVIIMFSGGSDSTNMLRVFLDNNIKPDRVWSMLNYNNKIDKRMSLPNVEITRSAWPLLRLAEKNNILVETPNQAEYDVSLEENWFLEDSSMRLAPDIRMRRELFFNRPDIKNLVSAGKKVCFVHGYDKPRLKLMDNSWYLWFLDTWRANHWTSQHKFQSGPFIEYFYFTPDMPELISKSCHLIIKYFENMFTAEQCKLFWDNGHIYLTHKRDEYNKILNKILYPSTWSDLQMFSLGKNDSNTFSQFFCQKTQFIIDSKNHWQNYKSWANGLKQLQQLILPKWYTADKQINGHVSKSYFLKNYQCQKQF